MPDGAMTAGLHAHGGVRVRMLPDGRDVVLPVLDDYAARYLG